VFLVNSASENHSPRVKLPVRHRNARNVVVGRFFWRQKLTWFTEFPLTINPWSVQSCTVTTVSKHESEINFVANFLTW